MVKFVASWSCGKLVLWRVACTVIVNNTQQLFASLSRRRAVNDYEGVLGLLTFRVISGYSRTLLMCR